MSRLQTILVALTLLGSFWSANADMAYYLDVNGAELGSGVTNGGVYDAGGTNWSTDSTGESGTTTDQTVSHGGTLIFSAGTDASGASYTVDGSAGQTQGGIAVQDGNVNFTATGSLFWRRHRYDRRRHELELQLSELGFLCADDDL